MAGIEEITPAQARERQASGSVLIDVREPGEHALGLPEGALAVPRAAFEAEPGRWAADRQAEVLLICGSGKRSLLAAQALLAAGYARPVSVAGGFTSWRAEGLPEMPGASEDADFLDRYSRHLRLPQVGIEGQRKLAQARV